MKLIIAIVFKLYFLQVLEGRYISIENPKQGRYSKRQLKKTFKKIKKEQKELQIKSKELEFKSYGNRIMVFCGVISLAAYRVLRNEGTSHKYATLLVSDVIWKYYKLVIKFFWLVTGLVAFEPQKRLNYTIAIFCKFLLNKDTKGYRFKMQIMPNHFSLDYTQCTVHQLMKTIANNQEMDFFRNSWCLFDFALPAYLTEGGYYEREHTLSNEDNICDMKWYAKSSKL